ncbi:MAG TPA: hypothetical protein VFV28_00835, partial [Limnobacter sp.]|nr:hypothetical protein [Limnobacter sp.]
MKTRPLLKTLLLAVSMVLVGACSAIRLGYNNAPAVAYTYLGSKVDFTDEQSAFLKASLAEIVQWHRRN